MFEAATKSKIKKASTATGRSTKSITCPKCEYARLKSDSAPEWQCPNCHIAYNKFGSEEKKRNKALRFNRYDLKDKLKSLTDTSTIMGAIGVLAFTSGLPSEACICNGVSIPAEPSNPLLLGLGAFITIFSIGFYFKNRKRIKEEHA
ncbi:MAG: hypothetical protein AseanaTS_01830 [Candidatus Pelagadaptatus aseana]